MGERPLYDQLGNLLEDIGSRIPNSTPLIKLPSNDGLKAQLEELQNSLKAQSGPAKPKKTRQQLNKELDENLGWAQLLTIDFAKGLTSPVSSLLTTDLAVKQDKMLETARKNVLSRKSTSTATDYIRTALTGLGASAVPGVDALARMTVPFVTPENVVKTAETGATISGSAVSSIPFSEGSRALVGLNNTSKLAQPMPITEKAIRQVASATSSGVGMSAFARLEPGESRAVTVAKNAAIAGATEVLLAPLFLRSWRDELGPDASKKLVDAVSEARGIHPKAAEASLTSLRAGASDDVRIAEQVVKATQQDPELRNTPIVAQAQKRLEATFGRILPKEPPAPFGPDLFNTDPNYGISLDVVVNGKKYPIQIRSNKEDLLAWQRGAEKLRKRVLELSEQGADIKFENYKFHSAGTYSRFKNYMLGKDRGGDIKVDPKDLPGAAPRGTVAETGTIPPAGTPVQIVEEGKPARTAEVVEQPKESVEPNVIQVKNAVGTLEGVPSHKLKVDVASAPEPVKFTPPAKGTERRFLVHNDQKELSFEDVSANPDQNYFRSPYFEEIDSSADLGHDIRGYIHDDGSVTLSVPQVQRFFTTPHFAYRVEDMGPKDTIGKLQSSPTSEVVARLGTNSFGGQTAFAENNSRLTRTTYRNKAGEPVRTTLEYQSPLSFGAGYVPKKLRDDRFAYPKWMGQMDKVSNPLEGALRASTKERKTLGLVKSEEITAQARGFGTKKNPLTKIDTVGGRKLGPAAINNPKSTWLDPDMRDVPEIITARDSARILLKRGIDPETKVRVRASQYSHGTNGLLETPWTLRTLSQYEPHMVPLDALRQEASYRGYTFIPQGRGGILRDIETGAEKHFEHQLEAAEHLGRIPLDDLGPKLEDPLEKAWRMGWYRSFDADVDATRFHGVDAQEFALNELVGGKRPLVHVWSSDPDALSATARDIEKARGLARNTFHVQELDPTDVGWGAGRGKPFALYDPIQVQKIQGQLRPAFDAVGLKGGEPGAFVSELSKLPRGLDVLLGRDPESALVYSYLRKLKMKDEWELGKIQTDHLGAYRVYDPQMKSALFRRIQGASRDFEPNDYDLEDIFPWPEEVSFTPEDVNGPPHFESDVPPEDVPPVGSSRIPGGTYSEPRHFTAGPMQWLRPPSELYKDLEAQTKVPFWTSWKVLQDAKGETEASLAAPYKLLNAWKDQYSKGVREQAQLLFEKRMSGESVDDLLRSVHPNTPRAADELEQSWRTFLGEMDFSDQEMREFFATFPQIRKNNGDYKTFVGGRQGLPKLNRVLSEAFNSGDIRIDNRELDGFVLGRRIMRMVAQEKHLQGPWEAVRTKMHAYAKSESSIPPDLFEHFLRHMQSIKHQPDAFGVWMTRFGQNVAKKLAFTGIKPDAFGDLASFITGINYSANMAWRPGLVLRNMLQTLQTTYPIAGEKYTGKALQYGIDWLRNPKMQEEMIRKGVIPREALAHSFADIQDFVLNAETGRSGKFGQGLIKFMQKGTAWYKTTDDFNRVVAYQAQFMRAKDEAEKYLEHGDWNRFVVKSKLDMQDDANGPLRSLVQRLLVEQKDVNAAAHAVADNFHRMSQFQYARENAPRAMQGTLGRLFGQYGTWSMSYVEYLRSMATRGSWENRSEAIARWAAVNYAVYKAADDLFGVNAARWVFFSPADYSGGPLAQIGSELMSAKSQALNDMTDSNTDSVTKMQAGRLGRSYRQFVPGFGAGHDIYNALQETDFAETMKRLLNMPSSKKAPPPVY